MKVSTAPIWWNSEYEYLVEERFNLGPRAKGEVQGARLQLLLLLLLFSFL